MEDDELNPEHLYLSAACDAGVWSPAGHGLSEQMFHTSAKMYRMVDSYHRNHRTTPPVALITKKFPDFDYTSGVDLGYAADAVAEEDHRRRVAMALTSAAGLLTEGLTEQAVAAMSSVATRPRRITGTLIDDPTLFFDDEDLRKIPVPGTKFMQITGGGIAHGHYWVLGARMKVGKTWELSRHVVAAASAGVDVVFFSLESPKRQISSRIHALMLGGWPTPGISPSYRQAQVEAWLDNHGTPRIRIIDREDHGMITAATVAGYAKPGSLIIIDYVGLMHTKAGSASIEDWRVAATVSNELREVSLSEQTAILAAVQLNRNAKGAPDLAHIADTDVIARDVDLVRLLHRPETAPVTLHSVAAYRHGASGQKWWTAFNPQTPDFPEVTAAKAQHIIDNHATTEGTYL